MLKSYQVGGWWRWCTSALGPGLVRSQLLGSKPALKVIGWVVGGGGGPQDFSVSPSPLWVNLGFKLGWTGLGLGLEGLGTNGFGVGD